VLLKGGTHLTATTATTTHASIIVANHAINKIQKAFEVSTETNVGRSWNEALNDSLHF
jgi:hypothetical protein